MKKKTVIFGFGSRGKMYGEYALAYPEEFEVVSVVENDPDRIDRARKMFPEVPVYVDYRQFLKENVPADLAIIATQDKDHKEHATAFMRAGYDLLLEKPIAATEEDCTEIYRESVKTKRKVFVCHVLRYSAFYDAIKKIIEDGSLGEVVNIHASENVGYYHQAHSFVRGPWRNSAESSPMILAKCCHDMDILRYLIGERCLSVSSYGSLFHFRPENAPEGSAKYCSDCGKTDCIYKAQTLYTGDGAKGWFATYFSNRVGDRDGVLEDLRRTRYDKCVYRSDNDVVDHQSIVALFDKGKTACHTMTAFSREIYRDIKVYGTKAELYGVMEDNFVELRTFGGGVKRIPIDVSAATVGGHNGSDYFMMKSLYKALSGEKVRGITTLDVSLESHLMCFAAEKSRLSGGAPFPIGGNDVFKGDL